MDVERRLGLPAGRYTQAGPVLPLLVAVLMTIGFYAALIPLKDYWINQTFTQRGWVPYATVFTSFWALLIVFIKSLKIAVQRQALAARGASPFSGIESRRRRQGQTSTH
jgi:hypothetical protein